MRSFPCRCAALLGLALPFASLAQTAPAPADTARYYRHHLGLTASPVLDGFFRNNRSLPLGLLYKRQVKPAQALRARAEFIYDFFEQVNPLAVKGQGSGDAYRQTIYRIEAAFGKEYAVVSNKRFAGYVGLEAGGFYGTNKRDFEQYTQGYQAIDRNGQPYFTIAVNRGNSSFNDIGLFVQPLAGVRYQFLRRLYAEAEATLPIRWTRTQFQLQSRVSDFDTGTLPFGSDMGEDTYYRFTATFRPISTVHLVLLF
ncbi:hypothetical protein MUN81_01345 [Hymenobacter sp. 5317J-9]|uniref:hypothetical protein n=1 Tax=Hymenobacter sp. 5317J-9 TaxID=2932250 RepID=UPI001FD6BD33|nr:hypothetical protein [Hymenobacter sp. 5317J-9]UOQ98150.1 hypothetical protein MUN81_01345 [Hymenobacter sp. 5317J-9]